MLSIEESVSTISGILKNPRGEMTLKNTDMMLSYAFRYNI